MKDREIDLQLQDIHQHTEKFTSLIAFIDFCKKEAAFWKEASQRVQEETGKNSRQTFLLQHQTFTNMVNSIQSWNEQIDSLADFEFHGKLKEFRANHIHSLNSTWLWRGHPFIETFIRCLIENGEKSAAAFLDFIIHRRMQDPQRHLAGQDLVDAFKGHVLAYEFLNQKSDITKRSKSEKKSLEQLRQNLSEAADALFSDINTRKESLAEWEEKTKTDFINRTQSQKDEHTQSLHWRDISIKEKLVEWTEKIESLETLYREKLRLEAPAKYWNQAASRYNAQGSLWLFFMAVLVLGGLVYFYWFFITWLKGDPLPLTLHSLQGIFIFATIGAVYAYLMRVLSRLAFSAFHLMRDAEEREQLTYLYLSLSEKSAIDEKSRDIVLQALFSRSETGLLAQEHGPTMPSVDMARSVLGRGGNP